MSRGGLRWRCGASRGSRLLSGVVKEALRKHEIAADDSFKAELTTRLVGKSSRAELDPIRGTKGR